MPPIPTDPPAILRRRQVQAINGHPRSTLYRHVQLGLWTRPVRIGPRSVGWPAAEVAALNAARIAGQSDEQIRALVAKLHAVRSGPALESEA